MPDAKHPRRPPTSRPDHPFRHANDRLSASFEERKQATTDEGEQMCNHAADTGLPTPTSYYDREYTLPERHDADDDTSWADQILRSRRRNPL